MPMPTSKFVHLILLCCYCLFTSNTTSAQVIFLNTTVVPNITFSPSSLGVFRVGDERTLWLSVDTNDTAWSGPVEISCEQVLGCPLEQCLIVHSAQLDQANGFAQRLNLSLKGTFVGLNRLFARSGRKQFWIRIRTLKTPIDSLLTRLFTIALGIALFTGNLMAGLQLNSAELMPTLAKHQLPVALACLCQLFLVPMIGYFIAKYLLTGHLFVVRLAFFMVSCTPAGAGKSAFWSILFDGNLELVAVITLAQRIGTVVFLPLWLHFLGRPAFFVDRVHIPLAALGQGLGLVLGPFLLGMLLARFGARDLLGVAAKCLKPLLWLATISFLCLACLVNWSNLRLLSWELLLCVGFLLPCAGHLAAFLLAKAFRLEGQQTRTLVIECGVQSAGLSAFVLLRSLAEPERDVALAVPVAVALLTDKPLLALCAGRIGARAVAILSSAAGGGGVGEEEKAADGRQSPSPMGDNKNKSSGLTTPTAEHQPTEGENHRRQQSSSMITAATAAQQLWGQPLNRVKQLDELGAVSRRPAWKY